MCDITSADDLVDKMIRLRETDHTDAGDVTIDVQDDMPLVTVTQRGVMIGMGGSITAALQDAVENIEAGQNPRDPMGRMEYDPPQLKDSECWLCGCDSELHKNGEDE